MTPVSIVKRGEKCVCPLKVNWNVHILWFAPGSVWCWRVLYCIIRSLSFFCVLLCHRVSLGWRSWLPISHTQTHTPHWCSLMPQARALNGKTCVIYCSLQDSDQYQHRTRNGCLFLLIYAGGYVSSGAFYKPPDKCHNFHNHKGHCYVIPTFGRFSCTFGKREWEKMYYFYTGNVFWFYCKTQSITSVLHASLSGQAGSCCFGGLLDFSKVPACQGSQHKRSDHIASTRFALQAKRECLILQLPQA